MLTCTPSRLTQKSSWNSAYKIMDHTNVWKQTNVKVNETKNWRSWRNKSWQKMLYVKYESNYVKCKKNLEQLISNGNN